MIMVEYDINDFVNRKLRRNFNYDNQRCNTAETHGSQIPELTHSCRNGYTVENKNSRSQCELWFKLEIVHWEL